MNSQDLGNLWEFGPERVYIFLAIARSKDNEEVRATDQPAIRKVVREENEIQSTLAELEHAVSRFDYRYRLYATVNARNTVTAFRLLQDRMTQWTYKALRGDEDVKRNLKRIDSEWKSILHKPECRDDKHFLFDLDDVDLDESQALLARFRAHLDDHTTIVLENQSPNGYHFVTEPFNPNDLDVGVAYELKKDDMVFVRFLDNGDG